MFRRQAVYRWESSRLIALPAQPTTSYLYIKVAVTAQPAPAVLKSSSDISNCEKNQIYFDSRSILLCHLDISKANS